MAADASRLADPEFWQLPLEQRMHDVAELRDHGAIHPMTYLNRVDGTEDLAHAVLGHDELVQISKNPKDFCSGQGATSLYDLPPRMLEYFGSFINMDDPRHARQRTIVSRTFTPRSLHGLLDSVQATADEVIDEICERGEIDLVTDVSQPFPLLMICDLMGIPRSEFDLVLRCTNTVLAAGDPEFLDGKPSMEAAMDAGQELVALMDDLADHKRANPGDDITSKLVHHGVDEESLTVEELGAFFILLAIAGNDTTRNAITYAVDLLSHNPDQRALLVDDPATIAPSAVEEVLRAASPTVFMRRTATRDVTISGYDLPAGSRVALFYGAANRDPAVFDDPHRFDVRRSPNPHVGFGGPGPHFCLGAHLARREVTIALQRLYTRLPDLEAAGPPVPLQAARIPVVAGIKHLPVSFTPSARVG